MDPTSPSLVRPSRAHRCVEMPRASTETFELLGPPESPQGQATFPATTSGARYAVAREDDGGDARDRERSEPRP